MLIGAANPLEAILPLCITQQVLAHFRFLEVNVVSLLALHVFSLFIIFVFLDCFSHLVELIYRRFYQSLSFLSEVSDNFIYEILESFLLHELVAVFLHFFMLE